VTFFSGARLVEQLRAHKESLLPVGTLRRRFYDWCRIRLRAVPRESAEQVPEQNHAAQSSGAEPVRFENGLPLPPDDLGMRVGGTRATNSSPKVNSYRRASFVPFRTISRGQVGAFLISAVVLAGCSGILLLKR
jgi:hypothetical protein